MSTTTEKLFVQIFDRKRSIIEQVRHEIDLYRQQLAPRLVIDGVTPPSWLWKHGSRAHCSDPAELRKEELMSELLLPVQQPSFPYSTCQNSLFNNAVFTVDKEPRTSIKGLDDPTCSHRGCINNVDRVSESVTGLEPIITPFQDKTGAIMLDDVPKNDRSLARFQRSRSRQKALEIRNSAKTADHDDKVKAVSSGGIAGIVPASLRFNHGNKAEFLKALEMASENFGIGQENGDFSQSKERHSSIHSDRNAVGSSQQPDCVHNPGEFNNSSGIANDDTIRPEGNSKKITLKPHNHVGDSPKPVLNSDVKSFCLDSTILGQTHLKEQGCDGYHRQVTRTHNSCRLENFYSVLSESALSPDILRPDGDAIQESQVQAKESSERLSKSKGNTDFSAKGAQVYAGSSGEKDPDSNLGSTGNAETVGNYVVESEGGSIRPQTPCCSQGMPAEHGNSSNSGSAMMMYRYADSNQFQNPQTAEIPSALPPLSDADEYDDGSVRSQSPSSSQGSPEHRNFNSSTSVIKQSRSIYAVSNQYQSYHDFQTTSTLPTPSDADEQADGSIRSQNPCSSQGLPEHGNSNISGAAITHSKFSDSKQYQSNHASQDPSAMPPRTENGLDISTANARVHTSMGICEHECSSRNTSSRVMDTSREKSSLFNSNISVQATSGSSAMSLPKSWGLYGTEDNEVTMDTDLNASFPTDMIDIHDERCTSSLEESAIVPDTPVDDCMDSFPLGRKVVSPGVGLEVLPSMPSSISPMLVKAQKLDFDDNNKCCLNVTSSSIEDREEEVSLETRQSTLLESLHITEPSQLRRASMEHSWPQSKRRKIEGQYISISSAPPSLTVKALMSNHKNAVDGNFNWEVSGSQTVACSTNEVRVTQTGDASLNLESLPDAKFHIFEDSNDSQNSPVEEGAHSSGGTDKSKTMFTFKLDELVPSMFSILTKQETGDSQCSRREEVGALSPTSNIIDVRRESCIIESPDLSLLRNKEGEQFLPYSVGSMHNQYLNTRDYGSYRPILEGFTVETEDEASFREENLSKSTLERASFLEQLCKSVSMHTPSAHFSSAYKLHQIPHLYQSVSNGLLENIDLKSTLYLTDDTVEPSTAGPSCFKDEVIDTFHASSYSDQLTNPRSTPFRSPVGRLWERTKYSKSCSSEKNRCSNPELTCFPIAEDPNICEETTDEVPDAFQDDIRSMELNNSTRRDPLPEVIDNYASPPALVSDVLKFNGRPSLESPTTGDSLGSKNTVKQKLGNHDNRKRRCTNDGKENQNMSIIANRVEHSTRSYRDRVSKSKLSRTNSLKLGGTSIPKKAPKLNNIVSNITSFIPFLQPKQAVTGKREIKVKALEAAEAAKRLEDKKENQRKMKKEALKIKRARLEQENLKQLELKRKEKEEAQKKKDEDMVAKKRAREVEEKKEKASKRKRIEDVETRRLQKDKEREEKVNAGKQDVRGLRKKDDKGPHKKIEQEKRDRNRGKIRETESGSIASSTDNVYKESIAVYGKETLGDIEMAKRNSGKATANFYSPAKSSVEQSYKISPYKESDDEEEGVDAPNNKFVPSWCSKSSLGLAVSCQQHIDVDKIFPLQSFLSINEVLLPRGKLLK